MTTNKPDVVAWKVRDEIFDSKEDAVEASAFHSRHCDLEPLIRLSDYEALQAECEALRKAAETSAADANAAERECSKALRALEGLERLAKVVSDNSDAVCGESNQLRVECEKLRKDAEQYRWLMGRGDDFQWENIIRLDIEDFPSRCAAIDAAMEGDKP